MHETISLKALANQVLQRNKRNKQRNTCETLAHFSVSLPETPELKQQQNHQHSNDDSSSVSLFHSLGGETVKHHPDRQPDDEIKLFGNEHYIKQCYEAKCANCVETGSSESEAQHQALSDLALRFIDITQVSYDSLELWNFGQKLYKACGIPLMKDLYHGEVL